MGKRDAMSGIAARPGARFVVPGGADAAIAPRPLVLRLG
jgi:hypothetical protein